MPRKRIMSEFRIDEISSVDTPAQEGARVAIMKRAEDELPDGAHTVRFNTSELEAIIRREVTKLKGDEAMAEETKTDTDRLDAEDQPTVAALQAQLARAQAVVALAAEERAHFDALPEDARTAFLAKSADGRRTELDAAVKAAADADPVVYTTADGVALRKSAGEAFIALAKSNDSLRKEADALRAEREAERLEKRAEFELGHLPGDLKTRAAMLKAIGGIEDESLREAAHDALKAQNEAMSKAFETRGHGGEPSPGSPDDQLDKLAKAHAEKQGVSYQAAYADVLTSAEGRALYAKIVNQEVASG